MLQRRLLELGSADRISLIETYGFALRSDWSSGKDSSLKPQIGQSGWGRSNSREGTGYVGEKWADCRNEVSSCIAHHIVAVPPGAFLAVVIPDVLLLVARVF